MSESKIEVFGDWKGHDCPHTSWELIDVEEEEKDMGQRCCGKRAKTQDWEVVESQILDEELPSDPEDKVGGEEVKDEKSDEKEILPPAHLSDEEKAVWLKMGEKLASTEAPKIALTTKVPDGAGLEFNRWCWEFGLPLTAEEKEHILQEMIAERKKLDELYDSGKDDSPVVLRDGESLFSKDGKEEKEEKEEEEKWHLFKPSDVEKGDRTEKGEGEVASAGSGADEHVSRPVQVGNRRRRNRDRRRRRRVFTGRSKGMDDASSRKKHSKRSGPISPSSRGPRRYSSRS
jgi:hypothetical protein